MRPNFDYARKRGYDAGLKPGAEPFCPYPDKRTKDGRATFSRAFRKAWTTGYLQGVGDRHKMREDAVGLTNFNNLGICVGEDQGIQRQGMLPG